jgi:hypothetical protein
MPLFIRFRPTAGNNRHPELGGQMGITNRTRDHCCGCPNAYPRHHRDAPTRQAYSPALQSLSHWLLPSQCRTTICSTHCGVWSKSRSVGFCSRADNCAPEARTLLELSKAVPTRDAVQRDVVFRENDSYAKLSFIKILKLLC